MLRMESIQYNLPQNQPETLVVGKRPLLQVKERELDFLR
jgi:hypothetical protein